MFTKNKDNGSRSSHTPAPEPARSSSSKQSTRGSVGVASIICNDMVIKGSIIAEGALHIDGTVEGDVSGSDITIGPEGKIVGEVKGEAVKVKGEIRGSIRAVRVELETGAKVDGDILHSSLSIQPNAIFEGQVKHDQDPLRKSAPKPARSASSENGSKSSGQPTSIASGNRSFSTGHTAS